MKSKFSYIFTIVFIVLFMVSCDDDIQQTIQYYSEDEYQLLSETLNLPKELYEYGQNVNDFLIDLHTSNTSTLNLQNELNNHIATLGRVLFYDKKLSINNSVSCGSCHKQNLAFADNSTLSEGFDGELSLRNSLPLGNTVGFDIAYGGSSFVDGGAAMFGWDESNFDIQSQSIAAITSTIEMGMHDMNQVKNKLKGDPVYDVLFKKAFGTNSIDANNILFAIDRFVNSIISNQSRFDKEALANNIGNNIVNVHSPFDNFTPSENFGKSIYNQNCAPCHSADHSLTQVARANNGLDLVYDDKGVGGHTNLESDNGVFKVPFLRNIELTAPYMHDGRFETLEEVIDFYSNDIQNHENLNSKLRDLNGAKKFNFTAKQKNDLIAYLKTLTDENLLSDPKWSDPFK